MFQRAYVETMRSGWAVNGHFSDAGPGFHPKKQVGFRVCGGSTQWISFNAEVTSVWLVPKDWFAWKRLVFLI